MKAICILLFISVSITTFGQQEVVITGDNGEGLPGAHFNALSVSKGDSSRIIRKIANNNGVIVLPETEGMYIICVTYYGYDAYVDTLELTLLSSINMRQPQVLEEMVVTAQSKTTTVENAVQKVTVINEEQIRNSGAINLSDILTYQTGIRLSQDNVLGSGMDLGGVSGQNVKILIDGVPVIGRQNGNIDISQINLNNVGRIEIIEGPLSVNYGTNALAGTINIITRKNKKEDIAAELNPYFETIGNYNLTGSLSLRRKKHAIILDGGRNFFDGWTSGDSFIDFPKERLADTNRVKTWKPKEQYFGGMRYTFTGNKWNTSLFAKGFKELIINRGMPSAPYYETAFDDYYHTLRLDGGINTEVRFKKSKITALLAYNDYHRIKNTYFRDLTTLNDVLSGTPGSQDTTRFDQYTSRIIYFGNAGSRIAYQIGTDLNHSTGWGARINSGKQSIGDYAAFATIDWNILDSLVVKPGLRYAYNTTYNSPPIPSLNILYRIKKVSFRASMARGFRAPDLKELYLDFVDVNHNITGNPDLKSEDSWNYSLFINWMRKSGKNGMLKFEYGAYYNSIHNLITLGIVENSAYTYINIGEYSTIGQQFSAIYRTKRLMINANATYIGRYNIESVDRDVAAYSFSPEFGVRLNYHFIPERLQANLFCKYNGKMQSFYVDADDAVVLSQQDAYTILDASISADLLGKKQLQVTLGAKNLLNVKQVNVVGQSQGVHSSTTNFNAARGFSMFLSVKYRFTSKIWKDEK